MSYKSFSVFALPLPRLHQLSHSFLFCFLYLRNSLAFEWYSYWNLSDFSTSNLKELWLLLALGSFWRVAAVIIRQILFAKMLSWTIKIKKHTGLWKIKENMLKQILEVTASEERFSWVLACIALITSMPSLPFLCSANFSLSDLTAFTASSVKFRLNL